MVLNVSDKEYIEKLKVELAAERALTKEMLRFLKSKKNMAAYCYSRIECGKLHRLIEKVERRHNR